MVGCQKIWRSNDGGNSWTEITPPSSLLNGNEWVPWDISVSSNNPDIIWAARTSQYGDTNLDGHRVYQSTNGGTTWLNITTPVLDGEAITNIVHQKELMVAFILEQGGLFITKTTRFQIGSCSMPICP